ncbi:DUF2637 domain-containing protein [Actinoplanes sp. NPDC051633]|uniref:DUF2637 domain-containing protein n=1 Tax=Actinoplanes sp. NPDC051633 TaxID=3155670 RepID=UPI00341E226E
MPLGDRLIRMAMTLAVLVLATMSFVVSYRHAYALALSLGEDRTTARMIPLTVDLMLLASALSGLFCLRYGLPQPRLARLALLLGIGATIAVNVAHGLEHGIRAALFGGWPAIALVISFELMLWVVAASRSLDRRTIVTVEAPAGEEQDPHLLAAVEILARDATTTAKAIGRELDLPYEKARLLTKEARALIASA